MTACTSLPNLPAPLGAGGVDFSPWVFSSFFALGFHPAEGAGFLLSSSPGPGGLRHSGSFFALFAVSRRGLWAPERNPLCQTRVSSKIQIIQPKLGSRALCTCLGPGQALLGFTGAAFMNPHHKPALNMRIPCLKFSIQSYLGTRQGSSLRKAPPLLEVLPNRDRAPFGLVAHKQEKLF